MVFFFLFPAKSFHYLNKLSAQSAFLLWAKTINSLHTHCEIHKYLKFIWKYTILPKWVCSYENEVLVRYAKEKKQTHTFANNNLFHMIFTFFIALFCHWLMDSLNNVNTEHWTHLTDICEREQAGGKHNRNRMRKHGEILWSCSGVRYFQNTITVHNLQRTHIDRKTLPTGSVQDIND